MTNSTETTNITEQLIRSALFIPANNPGMLQNSGLLESDAVIYDLEDAIALNQKDSTRILLANYLTTFSTDCITIVRINPVDSPYFIDDMATIKSLKIDYILLAKADIASLQLLLTNYKEVKIPILALVESAKALVNIREILIMDEKIAGVLFGAEDFALDMGIVRTKQGPEIFTARQVIAYHCKAFNKISIDTPFTDVDDMLGLEADTKSALNYGFTGKACINPRQVDIVNKVFTPSKAEIDYATEIVLAAQEAKAKNLGVFSVKGKMVDAPIISRALQTLQKAKKAGIKT